MGDGRVGECGGGFSGNGSGEGGGEFTVKFSGEFIGEFGEASRVRMRRLLYI